MKEKDAKLNKILTDYAENNKPPQNKALAFARAKIASQAQKNTKTQHKRTFLTVFGVAAASVCLVATLFGVGLYKLFGFFSAPNGGERPSVNVTTYYTADKLNVRTVSREYLAENKINARLAKNAASEKFSLYTFKEDNKNALLVCEYRFATKNGYEDVVMSVELARDKMYAGNKQFTTLSSYNNGVKAESHYIDGEYVSLAYFEKEYVYCLSAYSPYGYSLDRYLEEFFELTKNKI